MNSNKIRLTFFDISIDGYWVAWPAGEVQEGGEHGLHHGLGLVPEILREKALEDIQQGLEATLADEGMGGLRLLDHVEHGPEA